LGQCGKFEFDVVIDREPMKMLKDSGGTRFRCEEGHKTKRK